ncbi:triple tyrosine motif-containing protein [Mangrovibacterium marinum]|uniref:Regulatory LuxR family protein n=1 Tax=Mangrovibacterium marinum TaxID=1639118 RepID=A0A2T5C2P6_9BACT|nr:triple tyrosine motif-containing protein [Mangrovibacterium marinum]PTN09014.1 regulatory LuxR family protein [Mangrovibacterium marinum]
MGQKSHILLVFFSLLSAFTFGQLKNVGIPEIRNFKKQDYQAGTQDWQIEKNSRNFLYFANNEGLLEYDGSHWILYGLPNPSLIRSLKIDDNDRIYTGQQNEFGYMEPNAEGVLSYHSLSDQLSDEQKNFDEIWRIHITNSGVFFQSFSHLFLYRDGRLSEVPLKNRIRFSFYVNGHLWIQDEQDGLMQYRQLQLVKMPGADSLIGKEIWTILPLNNTKVLIGTANNGVFEYDGEKLIPWNNEANSFLAANQIFAATKLHNSYFAFGTIQNGLMITDESGKIMQHINKKKGLQNNTILSIGTDQNQNLWLGLDNGIDYVEVNSPLTYIYDPEGFGSVYTSLIHHGKLYVGTNHGLFVKDWPEVKTIRSDSFRLIPGTVGQTWYLGIHQNVLLCGHNTGTFIIEGETATKISDVDGAWVFLDLKDKPNLLLGGNYAGLSLFAKSDDHSSWQFVKQIPGFNESSRLLAQDDTGNIWMSHGYKGIFKIKLSDDCLKVLSYRLYNSQKGLPADNFINLMQVANELIYTSPQGIYCYNKDEDTFAPSSYYNQLFNDRINVNYILEDSYKNLWYSSAEGPGVLRLQEDGSYARVSSPFEKLAGRMISGFENIYVADLQNTFIALEDGLAHYTPNYTTTNDILPDIFIREVYNIPTGDIRYPYAEKNPDEPELSEYAYKGNNLRFTYSCPDYRNAGNMEFSYMLANYNPEWSPWASSSSCEFMNLHEGEYTFKVKARINALTESNIGSYTFRILPPWYRTNLAYATYLFVGIMLIALISWFIYFRIQVSKRKERLVQLQKYRAQMQQYQREALISDKEIIRLRNEQLRGKMINLDKELANQTMSVIQKNKFLGKLKAELKNLQVNSPDSSFKSKISLIINRIDKEFDNQKQNELFETYFDEVHEDFFKRLSQAYPTLTPREMKLCAYIKMNISSKEIATLLNISVRGVEISRYRLRKKLNLDRTENLTSFISRI